MVEEKIEDKQQRTHQLTIRLEPRIYEALQDVAHRVGIKAASIAGLAIGDYVTKAQASYGAANHMQSAMAKEMSFLMFEHVKPMLTEEQLKNAMLDLENLDD